MGTAGVAQKPGCSAGNRFDPGLTLRAMLSAVVQQSKGVRSFEDLADELQYLAENLDDQQEYAFMRP